MTATGAGARKSSPPEPTSTPQSRLLPLQTKSNNIVLTKAPARTPGKSDAAATPTGPLSGARRRARQTPGRVVKPTTPHGIRAFEQRRLGLTPGRRRQSGRMKRDTPRDLLRQLSRVLPRREPTPEKENIMPVEEEDSDDDLSLESPRLSFGIHRDDTSGKPPRSSRLSIEKGRRAYPNSHRLSMEASLLGAEMEDSDPDDEDAPTTKLLDIDISDDEISMPTPTFGLKDMNDFMGDTTALNQLLPLTRSPRTPEDPGGPETPTADLSFALDIPNVPQPRMYEVDDGGRNLGDDLGNDFGDDFDNDLGGGFDLAQPEDDDELSVGPHELDYSIVAQNAPLTMGAIQHPLLKLSEQARKKKSKSGGKQTKKRARRDGLPKGVIKRVAMSFLQSPGGKKSRLKKGALDAIMAASDWFLEEASKDIAAYAEHAGRKTIDENDVLMLARRQRVLTKKTTLFSLAQKFLPGELVKDIKSVQRTSST